MTDPLTEAVPELTPEQYALLDALRDVAQTADAPAAKYATEQLARLAGEAFGHPLPEPTPRVGGVAGFLYGNPALPTTPYLRDQLGQFRAAEKPRATGGPVLPKASYLVGEQSAEPVVQTHPKVVISREQAVALGLRPAIAPEDTEPWPFKPGSVVRDEDGAETEWLDAAPAGVVVASEQGDQFRQTPNGWYCTELTAATRSLLTDAERRVIVRGALTSHELHRSHGPLTVVSLPDPQEACTDDAPAGDE